jgi:hypothetical protein
MFDNVALNIFIGLIFVFLIYSLLATIFQEVLARWLSLRSRMLQKAVRRMLQDQQVTNKNIFIRIVLEIGLNIWRFLFPYLDGKSTLLLAFYKYPSIKYLAESSWNSKPSYVEAGTFSQTIINLLQGPAPDPAIQQSDLVKSSLFATGTAITIDGNHVPIDPETLKQLKLIFHNNNGDMARFKTSLENWFNQMMDRASGWYKKQTQLLLFLIGFGVAVSFNVDSIAIYRILAKDKTARDNMVTLATNAGPQLQNVSDSTSDKALAAANKNVQQDIRQASNILSLTNPDNDSCRKCKVFETQLANLKSQQAKLSALEDPISKGLLAANLISQRKAEGQIGAYSAACKVNPYQDQNTKLLGWLLTAFAISLGSTFWFDLLSRIIQLRGTGPKPDDKKSNVKAKDKKSPAVTPQG